MDVTVRANREHLQDLVELLAAAYPDKDPEVFRAFLDYELTHGDCLMLGTWRAGRLIGAVGAFVRRLRYGRVVLTAAQMGLGVVRPEVRGRGVYLSLALQLRNELPRMNVSLAYGFSPLGAEYEVLFGAQTVPLPEYILDHPALDHSPSDYRIVPADFPADFTSLSQLYDQSSLNSTGSVVRPGIHYWQSQLRWSRETPAGFRIAWRDGRVAGYLRMKRKKGLTRIIEAIHAPGEASSMNALCQDLFHTYPTDVYSFCGPGNHPVAQLFLQLEARTEVSTTLGVVVVDGVRLIKEAWEDLTFQWACNGKPEGHLNLRADGYTMQLDGSQGDILLRMIPESDGLPLSSPTFLQGFFGLRLLQSPLATALFPTRDFVHWHSDRM